MELTLIQKIAVYALPVLFAITVHEYAHGWAANRLGDRTALMMGRLTLNPIKHIDPIGTLVLPAALLALGGFLFGWAKPVPVNVSALRNPRRDMVWVALAGPLSNLAMAIAWMVIMIPLGEWLYATHRDIGLLCVLMAQAGLVINVALMVFNLLPLPPLDGGRIVAGLLPPRLGYQFNRLEPYGFFILIGLMATGLLGNIMGPILGFLQNLVFTWVT